MRYRISKFDLVVRYRTMKQMTAQHILFSSIYIQNSLKMFQTLGDENQFQQIHSSDTRIHSLTIEELT